MTSTAFKKFSLVWLTTKKTKRASIALAVATTVCASAAAQGGCHEYRDVNSLAAQLSSRHFPFLFKQGIPKVVICPDSHFSDSVGGDFTAQPALIRIKLSQAKLGFLDKLLLHELGHAQVRAKGFRDPSAGGHGRPWMYEMIIASLVDIARKTASDVPESAVYFNEVLNELSAFDRLNTEPNCGKELRPNANPGVALGNGVWIMYCDYTSAAK